MNREKWKRISNLLITICFCVFVSVIMVRTIVRDKPEYSYYENRNLAKKPEYTVEGAVDGSYFSGIETYLQENSALRNVFLRMNTFLDLHVLNRVVVNDIVVTDQVLLPFLEYEAINQAQIEADAELVACNLERHAQQCEAYGGKFYYVAVPCQYVLFEDAYPSYLNNRADYTEQSAQALFHRLEQANVQYIDMLDVFEQNDSLEQVASKVDNHFAMQGAYETYRTILERVNADTERNLEILEDGEYTMTEVSNHYLGSRTRKLFDLWPSEEKLTTITGSEEPSYVRYDWGSEVSNHNPLYAIPEAGQNVLYGMYMGGDISCTRIDTNRPELPSILVYGDSFTNPVECILWQSFNCMDSLDFRYYSTMTLDEYIELYQPDIVICIRDYEAMLNATGNGQ